MAENTPKTVITSAQFDTLSESIGSKFGTGLSMRPDYLRDALDAAGITVEAAK